MAKRRDRSKPPREVAQLEHRVERLQQAVVQIRTEAFFSGPLPPPEILQGYEDTCPGAAERILAMAERQAEHRQGMETRNQTQGGRREWAGLIFGFILAMAAILGGVYLIANGHQTGGLTSIIGALASLVAVFVFARSTKTKELARKWREMILPKGAPEAKNRS